MSDYSGPYWNGRRIFTARRHRIANALGWIVSAALFGAMLTSPAWWPQ